MTIGQHMCEVRKAAGLTQLELATLAGVDRVTLTLIEGGKHNGRIDTIMLLADALGISIDTYVGHVPTGKGPYGAAVRKI